MLPRQSGLSMLYTTSTVSDKVLAANMTSILLIHGLGANPARTWTKKISAKTGGLQQERRVNWTTEFLPRRFPNYRILSFEHNAAWLSSAPYKVSQETARTLLSELSHRRKSPEVVGTSHNRLSLHD